MRVDAFVSANVRVCVWSPGVLEAPCGRGPVIFNGFFTAGVEHCSFHDWQSWRGLRSNNQS